MGTPVDDYRQAVANFAALALADRENPICQAWALEICGFLASHYPDPAERIAALEGLGLSAQLALFKDGTRAERQQARLTIGQIQNTGAPLPASFRAHVVSLAVFAPEAQAKKGRKRTENAARNAHIAAEIYRRREAAGCFRIPENPALILAVGPVQSVAEIEAADNGELAEWIGDRAIDGAYPPNAPESLLSLRLGGATLARIYRENRRPLIIRAMLERLAYPPDLSELDHPEP
jgi:hypothetical protein